jgi:hypothetical protein
MGRNDGAAKPEQGKFDKAQEHNSGSRAEPGAGAPHAFAKLSERYWRPPHAFPTMSREKHSPLREFLLILPEC